MRASPWCAASPLGWKNHRWTDKIRNLKASSLDRNVQFREVDARGVVLGRLAAGIAAALIGKDKVTSRANVDQGDVVVVKNAAQITFTHDSYEKRRYFWHTGYPGGLKSVTLEELHQKKPTEVLRKAVQRMLPRNKLLKLRLRKLRIFPGEEHPFQDRVSVGDELDRSDVDAIADAVAGAAKQGAAASVLPWSAKTTNTRRIWRAHTLPEGFEIVEELPEGWSATPPPS